MTYKLSSSVIYPETCILLLDFLFGLSIEAVVDDHRSSFTSINSGILQGSVLFPTFPSSFYSFSRLVSYSYFILVNPCFTICFNFKDITFSSKWLMPGEWSWGNRPLVFLVSLIGENKNMVAFNVSKIQFLYLSKQHNLPHN